MKKNLYTIKDVKVAAHMPPFFRSTDIEAQRFFHELVINPESSISKYPSDFELWYVGEYDDSTGELFSSTHFIISAVDVSKTVMNVPDPVALQNDTARS